MFARYVANAGFARDVARLEGDTLNTDDMTRVEFGFARGLGFRSHQFDVDELRSAATEHGYGSPQTVNGTLNRALVADRAVPMQGADWRTPAMPSPMAPMALRIRYHATAVSRWQDGDYAEAVAAWRLQKGEPGDSITLGALAESLADGGNADAEKYIDQLRPTHDIEADIYEARLQFRTGKIAEATDMLERAFIAAQSDPWPLQKVLERGLDLAVDVANRDRAAGDRLWRALAQPFSVHVQNDHRLQARAQIAWAVDWPHLCTEALAPMEPDVPFDNDLLLRRVRCYEATGDKKLAAARRDLGHFVGHEPMRFSTGLK